MQPEFVREQLAASKIQRKRERARQLRAIIDADKKEEARASNAYRMRIRRALKKKSRHVLGKQTQHPPWHCSSWHFTCSRPLMYLLQTTLVMERSYCDQWYYSSCLQASYNAYGHAWRCSDCPSPSLACKHDVCWACRGHACILLHDWHVCCYHCNTCRTCVLQ